MNKLLSGFSVAATTFAVVVTSAYATSDYFNGFEVDTSGWFDYSGGTVTRVMTGNNGVTSAEGSYHAVIDGPVYTNWGTYSSEFPEDGYMTEVDVYLDMALADGSDKRFDFSSAVNQPDGSHRRDFIFHVGTNPDASGEFLVSASNNAPGWPGNPDRNPITVTETGWYTLRHNFMNNGGVLEVTMELVDDSGTVVGTWVLSDPTDIIDDTVGGNRYGWFTSQRFDFAELAIDNSELMVKEDDGGEEETMTKSELLMESGVPGKGVENAPGLQKEFNPNSNAGKNAGKKK